MKKKNISFLIPTLKYGGAERAVSRLTKILNSRYNIYIIVFDNKIISYDFDVEIFSLNLAPSINRNFFGKIIYGLMRIIRYRKIKSKLKIDITYSFGDSANIINILSGKKDKKITSIRGYKRLKYKKNIIGYILKKIHYFIFKKSDRIVSVSKDITKKIIELHNITHSKIETIYNGYNTLKIKKSYNEDIDEKYKSIFDNTVIIAVGTLKYEKGYWHLLKAFYRLKKKYKNLSLLILGSNYNNYKKKLDRLITEYKLKDVNFIGFVKNPYKYIKKADLFVSSSIFEGFPNALVEAMLCKTPVIATDCHSGPKEIIFDNLEKKIVDDFEVSNYGILTKQMNIKEDFTKSFSNSDDILFRAIDYYFKNKHKLNFVSHERAKRFSYDIWYEKHVKLFENYKI